MNEVLALKYRPKVFEEVIGQSLTIKQLESAIFKSNLGHALLFCGTRGTGKTTTARIVAHELNKDYPDIYNSWGTRQHLVLTEIDAASNTGVDNVRDLIESIRYSTQGHRVVLLDEAHMLSKNAFNALLKTLEEPPPGVTFILLTTEPHKLLDTVRSRCQTYEFHEVERETLEAYYEHIMELEGVEVDVKAAALKACGSVRDGLSLLQKSLSGEAQQDNSKDYFELVGAIYAQDVATALQAVSKLRKVDEARVVVQTLEKWFYDCSMEFFGMKTPVRDFFNGPDFDPTAFDLGHLQKLFHECLEAERSLGFTPNSKIVLEMAVLKMCM